MSKIFVIKKNDMKANIIRIGIGKVKLLYPAPGGYAI